MHKHLFICTYMPTYSIFQYYLLTSDIHLLYTTYIYIFFLQQSYSIILKVQPSACQLHLGENMNFSVATYDHLFYNNLVCLSADCALSDIWLRNIKLRLKGRRRSWRFLCIFTYTDEMGYFRFGYSKVKECPPGLELPTKGLEIPKKLLWKYEETCNFRFFPWSGCFFFCGGGEVNKSK